MLVGIEYFPSLRAAQEAALTEALERRRVALERAGVETQPRDRRLARLLARSRRQVEQCCADIEDAAALRPGVHRA